MVYFILRFIFRIANRFYFKTFQVKGIENIPASGPVLLVANHPSAFMDPIVIGAITKRPLFFLAKGGLFQNKFSSWLFAKFHMIPIYRSHETPGQERKNKDVFLQCHRHFVKGGAMLIFPEGVSLTERKIKKIQSGASRICLGAEAENDFKLGLKIVTIGLNFSNPHKFQSDVFISIDEPINVIDYRELYIKDAFKAAHAVTDEIRLRLEKHVVAIQDSEVDKLVANIELIYTAKLLDDQGLSKTEMERVFNTTKAISDSVHYYMEHDPKRVERIKENINGYLEDLERLSLKDDHVKDVNRSSPVIDAFIWFFYLVLGFPIFIFGFINNYLPFRIPFWTARLISDRPEYYGSIALSLGTLTFIVFYSLQIWLLNLFVENWHVVLLYAILLPISGFFTFYYYKRFTNMRGNWSVFKLFYKKTNLMTSLLFKRQTIIDELEKGKVEFFERSNITNVPS